MRFTNLTQVSRSMLAAILAASIAFPVPAIAFAADTDNAPDESAIDSAESSQDGPAGTSEQGGNDPERFSGLIEGEDYSGLLITLDADASVSLLAEDDGDGGLAQGLAQAGLAVTDQIEAANGSVLVTADVADGKSAPEAVAAAQTVPGVTKAQPNYLYDLVEDAPDGVAGQAGANDAAAGAQTTDEGASLQSFSMPNDPYASISDSNEPLNQYWLYNTRITKAWYDVQTNGSVTVATLDTGALFDHEDLRANLLADYAWDAFNSKPLAETVSEGDAVGHGTMVAGIIAGTANNGVGIAGGSYNARVLPVKVWGDSASDKATTESVVRGYNYVIDMVASGAIPDLRVVNMSLGSYDTSDTSDERLNDEAFHDAIIAAKNAGIVTVCSGGNGTKTGQPNTKHIYPADFDECVSVTALNADGTNCYWSDYNESKDISAPGASITSTNVSGRYYRASGTSSAAPIVSSIFALMFAAVPSATVDDACNAVYATATPISDAENDRTDISGSRGAIDASAAVEALEGLGRTAFSDVHPGEWFYNAVYFAKAHGIMNGVGDTGEFQPSAPTTRAQAATVLYNVYSKGEVASSCNKPDVDQSEWYANAVNWCVAHGIMTGYDDGSNTFGSNDSLTREQMCKVLAIATKADYASADPAKYNALLGTEETDEWARPFVVWAVDEGLVNGIDNHDGTHALDPLGLVYRCQTAQIFVNSINAGIM